MRDILIGSVILTWTFASAHIGANPLALIFGNLNDNLLHILANMG